MYEQKSLEELLQEPVNIFEDAEVISRYTRAQAIDDGVLADVSELASEAGFRVPVAITSGVHADLDDIPPTRKGIESYTGRLWDLLTITRFRAKQAPKGAESVYAKMHLTRLEAKANGKSVFKKLYIFKVHSGPGDDGEHVLTIMRKDED